MIATRFEARIGKGDAFSVVVEPDATHPITLVVASVNEDRTHALARVRVRLSLGQAAVLADQLEAALAKGDAA